MLRRAGERAHVIQLRWSDEAEDTWRDVTTSSDPYETIKEMIRYDESANRMYGHAFHAIFRVKP